MGAERLPFNVLISDDQNNPAVIVQSTRIDDKYDKDVFLAYVQAMSQEKFDFFCNRIINWQHFAYQLRGTVGTESKEYIPAGQEELFQQYVFTDKTDVQLKKDDDNDDDPGIIVQKCMHSVDAREMFITIIQLMNEEVFEDFCAEIELLSYFVTTQNRSLFSHYPELIPRDNEHFWFNA